MRTHRYASSLLVAASFVGTIDVMAAPRTGAGRSPWSETPGPVCDAPELRLTWSGAQVGASAQIERPILASLFGCWDAATTFTWSASGARVLGDGMTVDVIPEADAIALTGCAHPATGAPVCRTVSTTATATPASVSIEAIELVMPGGVGDVVTVRGRSSAPGVGVRVFAKSDVYYAMAPLTAVQPDGTWQAAIWLGNDILTVEAVLFAVDVSLATLPDCTADWCRGVVDAATGIRTPVAVDGAVGLAASRRVPRLPDAAALNYLTAQLHSVGAERALAWSSLDHDRHYTYDQAVVATALALHGDLARAATVLDALVDRQAADGSWPFVFDRFGAVVDPTVRYAGATAWVALAMNAYDTLAGGTRYRGPALRALTYLLGQMMTADSGSGVRFNPSDLPATQWDESQLIALEHSLETYAAIHGHEHITGRRLSGSALSSLKRFVSARWRVDHFQPGYYGPLGGNDAERYLDTQYYAVMAFGAGSTYTPGLSYNCANFATDSGILGDGPTRLGGYSDFRAASWPQAEPQVWTEGSAGMLTALALAGPVAGCPEPDGLALRDGLGALIADPVRRPFPTATVGPSGAHSQQSSTAAAAWMAIADSARNPLRPWE